MSRRHTEVPSSQVVDVRLIFRLRREFERLIQVLIRNRAKSHLLSDPVRKPHPHPTEDEQLRPGREEVRRFGGWRGSQLCSVGRGSGRRERGLHPHRSVSTGQPDALQDSAIEEGLIDSAIIREG